MDSLDFFINKSSLFRSLVAALGLVLMLSSQATVPAAGVDVQCGNCNSTIVEAQLLKCQPCPVCRYACFPSTCCYALGALANVTNSCICKAIYNLGLESVGMPDQFRSCSKGLRDLNCCLST